MGKKLTDQPKWDDSERTVAHQDYIYTDDAVDDMLTKARNDAHRRATEITKVKLTELRQEMQELDMENAKLTDKLAALRPLLTFVVISGRDAARETTINAHDYELDTDSKFATFRVKGIGAVAFIGNIQSIVLEQ